MIFIVLHLIVLHVPDGSEVQINPEHVTSLRARSDDHKHFSPHVNCMVGLTDGKFVTVVETCDVVRELLERH